LCSTYARPKDCMQHHHYSQCARPLAVAFSVKCRALPGSQQERRTCRTQSLMLGSGPHAIRRLQQSCSIGTSCCSRIHMLVLSVGTTQLQHPAAMQQHLPQCAKLFRSLP
jgi:hypothetical protein